MATPDFSGKTLGQYHVHEVLGMGGMGVVYRAIQATLQREVALKVLPVTLAQQTGYLERFQREARTAATLEHPNIVPIVDYGTDQGVTFVVMRLLKGGTLAQRMEQRPDRRPALNEIGSLLTQLGGALDYAHKRGVIHRDLKPSNIMFDEAGNAYVVDFGIAKLAGSATALTASGMMLGTPAYMAPEQWQGLDIGPAADQYALAVVIYALLTGQLPFNADTPYALMFQHLNSAPPSAHEFRGDLPLAVADTLSRALSKHPVERFPTITSFAQSFNAVIQHTPSESTGFFTTNIRVPSGPTRLPSGSRRTATGGTVTIQRRNLWLGGVLLLVLLALVIGAVVVALGDGSANETPTADAAALVDTAIAQTATAQESPPVLPPAIDSTEPVLDVPPVLPSSTPDNGAEVIETAVAETLAALASDTPTAMPPSETPVPTDTATNTPPPPSDTATPRPSLTSTPSATATERPTATPSRTPTLTTTPSPTPSRTLTPTPSHTALVGYDAGTTAAVTGTAEFASMWTEANLSAEVVYRVPNGEQVTIVRSEGVWILAEYRSFTGWMLASNLALVLPSATPAPTDTPLPGYEAGKLAVVEITGDFAPLMADPDLSTVILFRLGNGEQVTIVRSEGVWVLVEYRGFTGWMLSSGLNPYVAPAATRTPRPSATPTLATARAQYDTPMRVDPNLTATQLFTVSEGETVVILGYQERWVEVEYRGFKGWVLAAALGVEPVTPTPTALASQSATLQTDTAMRTAANLTATQLFSLRAGETVTILSIEGTWANIEYRGFKGWILLAALEQTAPVTTRPTATPTPTDFYTVDAATAMRADPNLTALQLFALNEGDTVNVLAIRGTWANIEFRGFKGWVLLSTISPLATSTPSSLPASFQVGRMAIVASVSREGAGLFAAPELGAELLGLIPNDTFLTIGELNGQWVFVDSEPSGWMLGSTLDVLLVQIEGSRVNIRAGKGTTFDVLLTATEGERFYLRSYDAATDWCQVELDDNRVGWVACYLVTFWQE